MKLTFVTFGLFKLISSRFLMFYFGSILLAKICLNVDFAILNPSVVFDGLTSRTSNTFGLQTGNSPLGTVAKMDNSRNGSYVLPPPPNTRMRVSRFIIKSYTSPGVLARTNLIKHYSLTGV